jgi:hypothetical protein
MANKTVSEILVVDEPAMTKRRGRPNKEVCLWNDSEYKANYFKKYFEEARLNTVMVECECGKKYSSVYKYKHMHSKWHTRYEELKNRFSPNAP